MTAVVVQGHIYVDIQDILFCVSWKEETHMGLKQ